MCHRWAWSKPSGFILNLNFIKILVHIWLKWEEMSLCLSPNHEQISSTHIRLYSSLHLWDFRSHKITDHSLLTKSQIHIGKSSVKDMNHKMFSESMPCCGANIGLHLIENMFISWDCWWFTWVWWMKAQRTNMSY